MLGVLVTYLGTVEFGSFRQPEHIDRGFIKSFITCPSVTIVHTHCSAKTLSTK